MRNILHLVTCAALAATTLPACVREPGGFASFTLASRKNLPRGGADVIAHIDEERCSHLVLFVFGWGDSANHEGIIQEALEKHGGDAVTNADLQFTMIPTGFYNQSCARVVGDVVRLRPHAAPPPPAALTPTALQSREVTP